MTGVQSLAYVALDVSRPADWSRLLEQVFGAEPIARAGAIDYRIDGYHHRLTLSPSDADRVTAVGWEVADRSELDALVRTLEARGITVNAAPAALCEARAMLALYTFFDPMIGVPTELARGPRMTDAPYRPSRSVTGFKTGTLGLGHIVFWVADLAATVDFYTSVMGFRVSDTMAWDDNDAVFLHCSARHHSLAVMAAAPGRPAGKLGHIMLEALSRDDVGHGYDMVRDLGIPVVIEPGKHSNDHMQSFYLETPSGFWMEYGYDGIEIGDDWQVKHFDAPMLWGHRMVAPPA